MQQDCANERRWQFRVLEASESGIGGLTNLWNLVNPVENILAKL